MKTKRNKIKKNKKNKIDEYINIDDFESNELNEYNNNNGKNNNQDEKYKNIMKYCLIIIIIIKIYILISFKDNTTTNKINLNKHNELVYIDNLNKTNININDTNKSENKIIETEKTRIETTNKNANIQTSNNIIENNFNYVTSNKIFWKNNKEINFTKINEEISMYENMTPSFNNKDELYKRENPKVSIIITVYNQEKFIKKIYVTIEQQSLKDIEIIFVDDCSKDNSSKTIEELQQIDKRIVYVKNEENKGVFYSRNNGVMHARGEYIVLIDVDDYLLNDILIKSYETAKMYNLDILQYYVMAGDFKKNVFWKVLKFKSGILRGNDVKNVFFYGTTRNTWDKFVKRETYIKSIEFMKEKYRKVNYVVFNDDVAIFGLFKVAQSWGFLEEIGYIYNWAVPNSETHRYENKEYVNAMFKCCFATMEYFYEQTENNLVEKRAGLSFFLIKTQKVCAKSCEYLTEGFDYVINVLDIYLNSQYYNSEQKKKLEYFKNKVIKAKENRLKINSTMALNNTLNNNK